MTTSTPRDTRNKGVTRDLVTRAAVALLEEGGPAALSMRKVAMRLGVSPTALYNHVQSKDDLVALVARELRAQVVVDDDLPTRAQLLGLVRQLRDLGVRHPALLEGSSDLASSAEAAEIALLQLRLLRDLGLTPTQIRIAYQGLVLLVNGAAVVWRATLEDPTASEALRAVIAQTADPGDRQLLAAVDDARPTQQREDVFTLAFDQVLDGAARWRDDEFG